MSKYLDLDGLSYLWGKITSKFVAKETGKGLSTNDFTTAEKTKLAGIEAGAEVNTIETIKVNGTALTPVDKGVNIPIAQYIVNGTSYKIIDIKQATVNNVEGFYIHYDNGSVDGGFVFVPNMNGVTYASGQIISIANDNAETLVNGRISSATPLMDGTASVGISDHFSREDHVHPTDTSRQATLVSGTNIKTINGTSILGSGDLTVSGGTTDYTDLTNKPTVNSVTLTGNKTASDLGLQNAIEVVTKTASDTTNTLETDKFYVFPTMTTLSVTVTGTGMYTFRFTSGSTATTLTVTGATMPDSFTVEANKVYEINIYQGYGVVSSWTAS